MGAADTLMEEGGESTKELEFAPALIAVHPSQKTVLSLSDRTSAFTTYSTVSFQSLLLD